MSLAADRRLYVTADKDQVVEEGDPRGAWLLYPAGRAIGTGDVERYGMKEDEAGRLVYEGCPSLRRPELRLVEDSGGPDDSDRNHEPVPEWSGRTSPKAYLKRYPTGPKAELAAAVIAAQDDGADGGS